MNPRRFEIIGRDGKPVGHVDLLPLASPEGEYKIVIQFQQGYQVLALRSEMFTGRISGILGRPPAPAPGA